jgi:hypothetical protein
MDFPYNCVSPTIVLSLQMKKLETMQVEIRKKQNLSVGIEKTENYFLVEFNGIAETKLNLTSFLLKFIVDYQEQ